MIQHFSKFIFVRVFKKRDFGGFQVLGVHFLPFCENNKYCDYYDFPRSMNVIVNNDDHYTTDSLRCVLGVRCQATTQVKQLFAWMGDRRSTACTSKC